MLTKRKYSELNELFNSLYATARIEVSTRYTMDFKPLGYTLHGYSHRAPYPSIMDAFDDSAITVDLTTSEIIEVMNNPMFFERVKYVIENTNNEFENKVKELQSTENPELKLYLKMRRFTNG